MSIVIRDVREHELDSVLALNNNAGLAILPLDSAKLHRFYETAEYFRVAERDGNLAGFLVGFGSDSDHDAAISPGFASAIRSSSISTASWWPAAAAAVASAGRSTPTCRAMPSCATRNWRARFFWITAPMRRCCSMAASASAKWARTR